MKASAFDHRPDRELGKALKVILSAEDDAAFADGVMQRAVDLPLPTSTGRDSWEILGDWAGPGLAAAVVGLTIGALIWLGGVPGSSDAVLGSTPLGDPLQQVESTEVPPTLLTTNQVPDVDAFLAFSLENR
ncbi:MAG: hypothetical protein ACE5HT_04595 [Gemmatimonadales bacterium]